MIKQTPEEKTQMILKEQERYKAELEEFKDVALTFKIANDPPIYTIMDSYIFSNFTYKDIYSLILYLYITVPDREFVFNRMKQETSMTLPYRLKNLKEFVNYTIDMYEFLKDSELDDQTPVEEPPKRCSIIQSIKGIFTHRLTHNDKQNTNK